MGQKRPLKKALLQILLIKHFVKVRKDAGLELKQWTTNLFLRIILQKVETQFIHLHML